MLPAQKEINDDKSGPVSIDSPVLLSAGKIVDSIHSLRQRLQDIDLDQITKAVERVSDLRERLIRLQGVLAIVTEVSACEPSVRQAQDQITQDLNQLKVKILEKLSRLRNAEPDKLIAIHDLQRDYDSAGSKPVPEGPPSLAVLDSKSLEADSPSQPEPKTLEPTQAKQHYREALTLTDKTIPAHHDLNAVADITPTYCGASSDGASVGSVREPSDDDLPEESKISNPTFDLTDEVLEAARTGSVEETHGPFNSQVTASGSQNATPSATVATTDFDQKLLDDLIKNYGEFAVSPDLPATVEPSKRSSKLENSSVARSTSKTDSAIDRPVVSYQNHGEFDRKLKKLIKDYGQVDLYSQHSSVKTKLRAVGAFAVLGGVLSGIYYFSAPKPTVAPSPAATPSNPSDGLEGAVTDSSTFIDKKNALPSKNSGPVAGHVPSQAIEASESLAVTDKQTSKKNIKKGGSRQ